MVLSATLMKRSNEAITTPKRLGFGAGKGAQRLQLKGEVEREDFVALVRNRVPRSKGEGRLTARDNTTREEWKLDPVTGQWGWKEVANRQTGYDWTFSVPKSVSLYLARTEDHLVEKTCPPGPCGNHEGGRGPHAVQGSW